ncbi:MAG: family 16 glycosylhydrolase [Solirubrobacteraceae bacterium]
MTTYSTLAKDFEFNGSSLPAGWSAGNKFNWGFAATEWMSSQVSMTGAKMPAGQGLWSGFWMLNTGSSTTSEIDVAEQLLGNLRTVYGSAHAWSGSTQLWGETQAGSLTSDATGWHDYQLIWQPGLLTWAIDGVAYAQYSQAQAQAAGQTWNFNTQSMYLIADLAVAGPSEWGGGPNSSTALPASMQLQSVKIWQ